MRYHKDHSAPTDDFSYYNSTSKTWRLITRRDHSWVCTTIKSLYIPFLGFTFNFSYESIFQNAFLQKAFYYSWSCLSKVYSGTAKWQQDLELVVGYGLQSHRYLTCGASSTVTALHSDAFWSNLIWDFIQRYGCAIIISTGDRLENCESKWAKSRCRTLFFFWKFLFGNSNVGINKFWSKIGLKNVVINKCSLTKN